MELMIDDPWWNSRFRPGEQGEADFVSRDGRLIVEVRANSHGVRGLYADMMRLAAVLRTQPPDTRAGLVVHRGRMSHDRLLKEWESGKKVLRPELARRLFVVVVSDNDSWSSHQEPEIEKISRAIATAAGETTKSTPFLRPQPGQKYYEILKVLLLHWLKKDGPQALGTITDEVGCTYPTLREALSRPLLKTYLQRSSTREVELLGFPLQAWQELVALSSTHRQAVAYVDQSGERPTPQDLKKRLQRLKRSNLALGGVASARIWDKNFDLHGTPRVDVTLHVGEGHANLDFVRKLDPALKASEEPTPTAVLVMHPIFRAKSFFETSKRGTETFSDPIEAALDLYEIGLNAQATQLLRHFRPEIRF